MYDLGLVVRRKSFDLGLTALLDYVPRFVGIGTGLRPFRFPLRPVRVGGHPLTPHGTPWYLLRAGASDADIDNEDLYVRDRRPNLEQPVREYSAQPVSRIVEKPVDFCDPGRAVDLDGELMNHLNEWRQFDVLGGNDDITIFLLCDNFEIEFLAQHVEIELGIDLQ